MIKQWKEPPQETDEEKAVRYLSRAASVIFILGVACILGLALNSLIIGQ
jgi:hypothetical protein